MRYKNIFWGIFFIAIGVLWLLHNQHFIYIDWQNTWYLWPFILVLMGISIIPIKDVFKIILDVIVLSIAIFVLLTPSAQHHKQHKETLTNITSLEYSDTLAIQTASLSIEAGGGSFVFIPNNELIQLVGINSNKYNLDIVKNEQLLSQHADIDLEIYPLVHQKREITIQLHPFPVWEMSLEMGACKSIMDMHKFKIKDISIEAGISDIYLKIGDLYPEVNIEVSTGASKVKIEVPSTMKCVIHNESALGNSRFIGFENQSGSVYTSPNSQNSLKGQIDISIESGVSNIEIIRY